MNGVMSGFMFVGVIILFIWIIYMIFFDDCYMFIVVMVLIGLLV